MKLSMHEVLMVPYKWCCFSARSVQGWIQGMAKLGHGGPLLQETSSSDQKATATNQLHSNDLEAYGKKCFIFGSIPKSNFWRVFEVFLDLVILPSFNEISMDFYAVKCLICISMFVSEKNAYIKDLNALRIFMNFLCIYLGEKGGGCTHACICMGTHSQPLLQNRLMDVYETW